MIDVVDVRGVQPTPREGRAALRAWPSIRRWATLPMLFFVVVVLGTMGLSLNVRPDMMVWIFVLQMAGLYGFVGLTALAHHKVMAMSRALPIARPPVDWRIDGQGIAVVGADFESRVGWRSLVSVMEEKDRLIFTSSPNANFILPLRVLNADQIAAVRAIVADVRARGVLGAGVD